MFLGESGVGKSELAKTLAKVLFGDESALIEYDMSEYSESFSVSKLIGAAPGYVGYDDTNTTLERIRRHPYSVILLDEIEKAHPSVLSLFLQVFDKGVLTDAYGRKIPKHAHGTENLKAYTASTQQILEAVTVLFDRIADPHLLIRRINLVAARVKPESGMQEGEIPEQLDLFTDYTEKKQEEENRNAEREEERRRQQAILTIRKKYGKNAILRGLNLKEGATARERNGQIGGHKA